MHINIVRARQIFDSRGYPTVECDVILEDGATGRASVASGASTGSGEAVELRDGGNTYNGKGVQQALKNIEERIQPALKNHDVTDQQGIDHLLQEIDGTSNKSSLGANATTAVSLAVARAAALSQNVPLFEYLGSLVNNKEFPLPMPMFNILNGGKHAEGSTDIQEFMIVPIGAEDLTAALRMSSEIYHALGALLKEKGYATTVGDEGGFAPSVKNGSTEAIELIISAIEKAGFKPGADVALALDVAASELVNGDGYDFAREGTTYTTTQLIERYAQLAAKYPIISLEDGLSEADWAGWSDLTSALGSSLQLVADDLLVTNPKLLKKAIEQHSANAILIKPNQIGSLSETIESIRMAQDAGWRTVISHRSGETEDPFIAHLAVGLNAGQIKTGSFARSERIAKYNELVRISEAIQKPVLSHPFAK